MLGNQLKFDKDFNSIVNKAPSFWSKITDIPNNIRYFIDEISNNIVIYDYNDPTYYCSSCFEKLDDFYCVNCNKDYKKLKYDPIEYINIIDHVDCFDKSSYSVERYYYVFDVFDGEVILYKICEEYSRDIYIEFHRSVLSIKNAFWICKDRIVDLINDEVTLYNSINEKLMYEDEPFNFLFDYFGCFDIDSDDDSICRKTLYVDNLEILKDTIYKYTNIWCAKEFLKDYDFRLLHLTYIPLHYREFEYLIKYKLYSLAFEAPHLLKGKNFKERFGVEKENLKYMQVTNIDYYELLGLQLSKYRNKVLNGFLGGEHNTSIELLKTISPNMDEFAKYIEKFQFGLSEYYDYIKMAKEMGYDLTDKKILYPDDFIGEHDKLYLQYEVLDNPLLVGKIRSLSNVLSFNIYEDEKYIIFPADTIESMIDEGSQQHNCLRTYIPSYSSNICQIYFMREKTVKDKSFVTIEVRNNKIVQARVKYNKEPTAEIMNILKKWEKTLLPIENEE